MLLLTILPRFNKTLQLALLLITFSLVPVAASAAQDYRQLEHPQPLNSSAKVVVEQWFWVGCQACQAVADLGALYQQQPDIEWHNQPVNLRAHWYWQNKLALVVQALHQPDLLTALQADVRQDPTQLQTMAAAEQWLRDHGVDQDTAHREISAPEYNQQLKQLTKRAEQLGITSVPAIVINGRYLVDASMATDAQQFRNTVQQLIDRVRQQQSAAQ